MIHDRPNPQITVLDAGGQYCHLIARRIREQGVYAEVRPSETPAAELAGRKGILISGGPSSVYEAGSPKIDPVILGGGSAVLGICYGQQLMAHVLDGHVRKGERGEYGHAVLELLRPNPLLEGFEESEPVWMSHRDQVEKPPSGFEVLAATLTCPVAAIGNPEARLYAVQFHPEVVHTPKGSTLLANFLFSICRCEKDWDPRGRVALLEQSIRESVGSRNVFFFVSGGVDSSVAYRLCVRALGPDRVHGAYVDTGLMRAGETDFVRESLGVSVVDARSDFLEALEGVAEPERKRKIIGEMFVGVQDRVLQSGHYLDGDWILGQGTIYPDTIESGGTAKAEVIKTHHNRVEGIQKLMEENRIIEPLTSFYKDEVRDVGRELGLPEELLCRHPFPGPGLAIRLLCSEVEEALEQRAEGWLIPVRSVGVQGDSRTYRSVLALAEPPAESALVRATELVNRYADVNRIVSLVASHAPMEELRIRKSGLSAQRVDRLRECDAIVRRMSHASGFDRRVWQFPVVVLPLGLAGRGDSVVLRPIHSVDGMTASAVAMDSGLLDEISAELLKVPGICAVFYDLTHKPPATIEWE